MLDVKALTKQDSMMKDIRTSGELGSHKDSFENKVNKLDISAIVS